MIKSILVALDGSPSSLAGLQEAVRWSAALDADVRGMFVEDEQRFRYYPTGFTAEGGMPVAVPLQGPELAEEEAAIRKEAEKIQADFEQAVRGLASHSEFIRVRGDVNDLLTREARAVDLVVMGRRGRNDPQEGTAAGPTTETLIHNAMRPVLVVPEGGPYAGSVVFAYDGSRGAQRVMAPGTELALALTAPVAAVSVGDNATYKREQGEVLQRYWRPHGIEATCRVVPRKGSVAQTLVEFASAQEAGMIAMGAFGHSPLHELFFGSVTLETLATARCPVLVMA